MIRLKLKIRVKQKDFIYFIAICIALFIGCAILAVNFLSFSEDGSLRGLNIFATWSMKSFWLTLLLFIVSLVVIFMNVSSTIFNFEKGGLGLVFGEKEEKGYNRWTTEKEMKSAFKIEKVPVNVPTSEAGGIVMVNDGKNMWVDDGEYHSLIIGQSGSGKTTALVDPQVYSLCKHGESMVITDPKGEIYKHHANRLRDKGYKIVVINFRDPREGNAWNPLTIPYRMFKQGKSDKAKELLEDISQNILIDPKNTNDPFWERSAADYFSGLALGLFEDAKENEVNITSISHMATVGEEKNGINTFAKDYFTLKSETSTAYGYAKATIAAPNDTKSSILSVFQSKIRTFSTREELSEMLSYSDFNMEDIGKEKTAVFLIVHDEKTTYHSLATIFIKQLYEVLIDVAHKCPNGELKYRTNFILDEFANMPQLRDVTSMVTAARSRKIRFTFIIQNFAQLDEVYGDKNAETIRSNCGNTIYLLTNELSALEEISKLCGEVKSKKDDKTVSTPLVTVTDLQKMKRNEIIVIRMRMRPFRTVLKGSYDIDWGDSFEDATLEERDIYPVRTFDMRQFVKEEKHKKTMEAINKAQNTVGNNQFNNNNTIPPAPNLDPLNFNTKPNDFNKNNDLFNLDKPNDFNKSNDPFNLDKPVDIDELVKNIDRQIAELEKEQQEEEKKRKEKENEGIEKTSINPSDIGKASINTNVLPIEDPLTKIAENPFTKPTTVAPEKKESEIKNNSNVDNSSVVLSNQLVTDDQFFDDFFGDDD